uniref:Uncharacterized protein n=1 Tax=Prolemur simus TaxID=1328070 RepID=A0A8C8YHQ2_PROSS
MVLTDWGGGVLDPPAWQRAGSGCQEASSASQPLLEAFRCFAVHGDTRATGKEMHGKNWPKLCKDCQVIDGKNVTVTDADIVFSKIK